MAKVGMISLGCPKNTVDSEEMLGTIIDAGHTIVNDPSVADIIIVNTCAFIKSAKEESIDAILEAIQYKSKQCRAVIVTGCLVQRYGHELAAEIPEVDAFVGLGSVGDISKAIANVLDGAKYNDFARKDGWWKSNRNRLLSTGQGTAYLRIADGCDNRCAYCAIPDIRGAYASRDMADVIDEAKRLADLGVKELNLIAQDITKYGTDVSGGPTICDLIDALSGINGIEWIRLLYCYPTRISHQLIDIIASNDKVCKYLDIPLQHSSNRILRMMNRAGTREEYLELFESIREASPDISLRTSFIVGFPGETQEDFYDLMDFMEKVRFDKAGVFRYSREDGTPAYSMHEQVPGGIANQRYNILMQLQQKISLEKNKATIGKKLRVLVESTNGKIIGRSYKDAPDIDGVVIIDKAITNVRPGDFIDVLIVGAQHYDLVGQQISG